MHVALRFAYDGRAFPRGYARQPEGGTVEDALLDALRRHGYVDGSWRTGSRTDRGVSAAENVAGCQLRRGHLRGLVPAMQSDLPDGVWLTGAARVERAWNPRHAMRTYAYFAAAEDEDLARMEAACRAFEGRHDMTAFAKLEDRSPRRDIRAFHVRSQGTMWRFSVTSPGFLWNQVRRMVDAVLRVGRGQAELQDIHDSLHSGSRHGSFQMAPADGLLLERVVYDPAIEWTGTAGTVPDAVAARAGREAAVHTALAHRLTRHGLGP